MEEEEEEDVADEYVEVREDAAGPRGGEGEIVFGGMRMGLAKFWKEVQRRVLGLLSGS